MTFITWYSIKDPPKICGWYMISILPSNFATLTQDQIDQWREKYGLHIGWFNPDSIDKWYIGEPGTSFPISHRVTHWTNKYMVPLVVLCPWKDKRGLPCQLDFNHEGECFAFTPPTRELPGGFVLHE